MSHNPASPNVVFIDCHDLGDWLGCYGRPYVSSPNIDRLAAQGILFTNHFATAPGCMPSRASMYTSQYPHAAGVNGQEPLDDDQVCIARRFQDYGYETYLCGSFKIPNPVAWAGYQRHLPYGSTSERTAEFFCERASENTKPFFAHFSFQLVHYPLGDIYDPAVAAALEVPPFLPDRDDVREYLACLCHQVGVMDRHMGRIVDGIRDSGLAENSIVVFTTEHGPELARIKGTLYDGGIRAALVMRYGRMIRPGRVDETLLSNIDLMPTMIEMAGLPPPHDIQGHSYLGLMTESTYRPRQQVYSEMTWGGRAALKWPWTYAPRRSLRTERWKFIRNYTDLPSSPVDGWEGEDSGWYHAPASPQELYDVQADPWELETLALDPAYAEVCADLNGRLVTHLRTTGDAEAGGTAPQYVPNKPGHAEGTVWKRQESGDYRLLYPFTPAGAAPLQYRITDRKEQSPSRPRK